MTAWDFYTGEHDAATNLAIDEVLLEQAQEGTPAVRLYDFERPAVILARNESYADVKGEQRGVDYTRRDTGGSVIYCDDNALFYSVSMPVDNNDYPERLHRDYFGPRLAAALVEIGVSEDRVGVGEHFSVRIDGKTVAGNSQRKSGGAVLYHGVLALEPWDAAHLDDLIRLRERDGERERDFIASLPGVVEYTDLPFDAVKSEAEEVLPRHLADGEIRERELSESQAARVERLVADKYDDGDWVRTADGASGLKDEQGFCFVDWTDEWEEDVRDYGFY